MHLTDNYRKRIDARLQSTHTVSQIGAFFSAALNPLPNTAATECMYRGLTARAKEYIAYANQPQILYHLCVVYMDITGYYKLFVEMLNPNYFLSSVGSYYSYFKIDYRHSYGMTIHMIFNYLHCIFLCLQTEFFRVLFIDENFAECWIENTSFGISCISISL